MERRIGTEEERTSRPTRRTGLVRKLTRGGAPKLLLLGQKRRASHAKPAGSGDGTDLGASDVLRDGEDPVGWECPAGTGSPRGARDPGDTGCIGHTISASNTRSNSGEGSSTGGEPLPQSCPSSNGPLSRVTREAGEAGQAGGSRQRRLGGARASWGALICVRKPREGRGDEVRGRSPRESQGQPGGSAGQGAEAGGLGNGAKPPGTGVCRAGAKTRRGWTSLRRLVAPRKERRGSAGKGVGVSGGTISTGHRVPGDPWISPVRGEEQGWTDPPGAAPGHPGSLCPGHQETGAPGRSQCNGGVGTVPAEGWVGTSRHAEGALGKAAGPLQGETPPPALGSTAEVGNAGMERGNPDETPPVLGDGSPPQLGLAPMSLAKQGGIGEVNGPEGLPIEDLMQEPAWEAPGPGRSSTGELGSSAEGPAGGPGQVLPAGASAGSSVLDMPHIPALAPTCGSLPAPSCGAGADAQDPRPWQCANGNGVPAEGGAGWGEGLPGQAPLPEAALHRVAHCIVRWAVEAAVAQLSAETVGSCDPQTPSSSSPTPAPGPRADTRRAGQEELGGADPGWAFHPGTLPQWDHPPNLPLGSHSQTTTRVQEEEGVVRG